MYISIWILVGAITVLCLVVIARVIYRRRLAKDAKSWLEVLREGNPNPELILSYFWDKLKRSRYSLEQIGTSDEELSDLTTKGHRLVVTSILADLHNDPIGAHLAIFRIYEFVGRYNLALSDVGTDEKELDELANKGRMIELSSFVNRFRRISSQRDKLLEEMRGLRRQIEDNGEFTLAELGTSQEELDRLSA